jgi:AAA15 family ATPase/GTPase
VITKVKIENFQSLEKTDLGLGTLTVIVGANDLGKSAAFRAIEFATRQLFGG